MKLVASGATPRGKSSKDFYESLGFSEVFTDGIMILPDFQFENKIKLLEQFFKPERIYNEQNFDLMEEFVIEKQEKWLDKLKNKFF